MCIRDRHTSLNIVLERLKQICNLFVTLKVLRDAGTLRSTVGRLLKTGRLQCIRHQTVCTETGTDFQFGFGIKWGRPSD